MDQDDSMLSTPSSNQDDTYDDDNLFPDNTTGTGYVAAQIPANDHLNAAAPGELSPPRSQSLSSGQQPTNGFAAGLKGGATTALGGGVDNDADFVSDDDEAIDMKGETLKGSREEKEKPGAGWKNKKVQEEMARAWENVVDRDFDIKAYGDPLAHKLQK